jgi:hypothetical protein
MGNVEDMDFGPDTDAIRRWLAKRATYAGASGDPGPGGKHRIDTPSTDDPQTLAVPDAHVAGRDVLAALAPEPAGPDTPSPSGSGNSTSDVDSGSSTSDAGATYSSNDEDPGDPADDRGPDQPTQQALPYYPTPAKRKVPPKQHRQGSFSAMAHDQEQENIGRSTNMVFKPRRGVQHAITVALVAVVAATALSGYAAYREQTNQAYGITGILAALAIIVWAIRASTTTIELAVIRGQLEMIRGGSFEVIDLASPYTPVLVEGRPGRRGWRVLIERWGEPLVVLDRSVVDPEQFMAVLYRIRPDLRPDAQGAKLSRS